MNLFEGENSSKSLENYDELTFIVPEQANPIFLLFLRFLTLFTESSTFTCLRSIKLVCFRRIRNTIVWRRQISFFLFTI